MNLPADIARELLDASWEAIVVVNNDGDIVYVSAQAGRLFGYDAGELIGQKVEILMPEAFRKTHEKSRVSYSKSPRSRPLVSGLDLKGKRKDGRVFDAEISLTPIETAEGLLISSTIRDITADNTSETYGIGAGCNDYCRSLRKNRDRQRSGGENVRLLAGGNAGAGS